LGKFELLRKIIKIKENFYPDEIIKLKEELLRNLKTG
jgi:hypothetical protein